MHVVCKPGIKKHCSGTILPLPHEATEVFLHHQTLNLHKKQTRPCQTDFPVSLSGITILSGIQEDTFDSLPCPTVPRLQSTSRIFHWTLSRTPFTDYRIIGFWRGKALRGILAIPVLPTLRTLKPREVLLEDAKHLKLPLGAGVHKADITVQFFWTSMVSGARLDLNLQFCHLPAARHMT